MATFVSHAQNREDVLLWRALNDVERGRYIDLGAAGPVTDSVTYAFYQRGWSGINIEPVQTYFEQLQDERPRDVNLNIGAGAETGKATLHELIGTGLSTFNSGEAKRLAKAVGCEVKRAPMQIRPMGEICREHHFDTAHFLKVDVEGMEEQALRGFDFDYCRPWVVVVESTIPNSRVQRFHSWEPLLTQQGYQFALFDGLNRFYLCEQHQDRMSRLSVPVNVFDGYRTSAEFYLKRSTDAERHTKEALEVVLEQEQSQAKAASMAADVAAREAAHQAELTAHHHQSELQAREQESRAKLNRLQSQMELEHQAAEEAKQLHRELLSAHVALEAGYLELQAQSKAQLDKLQSRMEDEQRSTEEAKHLHRELLSAHVALEAGYLELQAQSKIQQRQLKSSQTATSRAQDHSRRLKGELAALGNDLASLEDAYHALNAKLHQAVEQVAAQSLDAERQGQELAGREQALRAADISIESLRAELAESERQERDRSQQLQWVYESRSWQITAPLRLISRVVSTSLRLLARMVFEVVILLTRPLLRSLLKRRALISFGARLFNRAPALKSMVRGILARRGLLPGLEVDQGPLLPNKHLSFTVPEPVPVYAGAARDRGAAETEPSLNAEVYARLRERLGPVKFRS